MDNKKTPLSRLTSVLEGFEKSLMGFIDRQSVKRRDMQILLDQALQEKEHIFRQYNQAVEDVDRILMQLEVARRERDVALRNQGVSQVQKQAIGRLERDAYRVSEALERVDSIRTDVRRMLSALSDNISLDGADLSPPPPIPPFNVNPVNPPLNPAAGLPPQTLPTHHLVPEPEDIS